MNKTRTLTLRVSPAQYRALEYLERKLSVDKSNLIRLAISRLAEAEGFFTTSSRETGSRSIEKMSDANRT